MKQTIRNNIMARMISVVMLILITKSFCRIDCLGSALSSVLELFGFVNIF